MKKNNGVCFLKSTDIQVKVNEIKTNLGSVKAIIRFLHTKLNYG